MKVQTEVEWRLVWLVILMSLLLLLSGPARASSVPSRDAALLVRAVGLFDAGNQRAGVHFLQDYLASNPDDVEARRTLASFYETMGLFALARTELHAVIHAAPASTADRRRLMELSVAASEWSDALELAERILEMAPDDAAALAAAGRAAFNLERVSQAEIYIDRALSQAPPEAPGSGDLENMLGLIRLHQKRTREARELFTQAVRARPDEARFLNNLGYAHELSGRLDEAWMAYDRAHRLEPENRGFAANLDRIEARLKKRR